MQLTRRRFVSAAGALLVTGGAGLLAACQSAPAQTPSTQAPAPASTQPPTAQPAAAPAVSPAPTQPSTAASSTAASSPGPLIQTSPVPSPAVVASAAPSPAVAAAVPSPSAAPALARAAGQAAGKQMYQQDAQHTGRSPYAGPRQASLRRQFDAALPANLPPDPVTPRPDFQSSSVVGPDGTLYIANFPGVLFALRDSPTASDRLDVAWRFHPPTSSSFHATPALSSDGSTVYLGFASGGFNAPGKATFYALKAPASGTDPQVVWSVELGDTRVMASPTVGPDGTIYVANSAGVLFAIDPAGSVKWTAQTGATIKSAPALGADGTVYHATADGKMYALSAQGQQKWTFDFGAHLGPTPLVVSEASGPGGSAGGAGGIGSGASPTVGADGTVYIGANNSNMYAVTPDGQMKWLFEAERELAGIWTTPVLSADSSTLYFGANKGGIYALNASTGQRRWQVAVYGSIYASSVLDARGILYTGTTVEHLYAVESTSGEMIFDYDAKNEIWCAPSIRPDGTLVFADRGGLIQVIG